MSRRNTPILEEEQMLALEKGYQQGKSHAYRKRCQLILLKSEGRDSKLVGSIVKMCDMSVNNWVKRYNLEGIKGLETKSGRGRKPKLSKEHDQSSVLEAIKANRQRLATAKSAWESTQTDTKVSRDTFRRFLKALADDTNG